MLNNKTWGIKIERNVPSYPLGTFIASRRIGDCCANYMGEFDFLNEDEIKEDKIITLAAREIDKLLAGKFGLELLLNELLILEVPSIKSENERLKKINSRLIGGLEEVRWDIIRKGIPELEFIIEEIDSALTEAKSDLKPGE